MLRTLQNKALGFALLLVFVFAGGAFSVSWALNSASDHTPSLELSPSPNSETCQISNLSCSESKPHGAAADSNHCQQHCGHNHTGVLSASNVVSPNKSITTIIETSETNPNNIALDPATRPPNQ